MYMTDNEKYDFQNMFVYFTISIPNLLRLICKFTNMVKQYTVSRIYCFSPIPCAFTYKNLSLSEMDVLQYNKLYIA